MLLDFLSRAGLSSRRQALKMALWLLRKVYDAESRHAAISFSLITGGSWSPKQISAAVSTFGVVSPFIVRLMVFGSRSISRPRSV
jgi:hypothetical protein